MRMIADFIRKFTDRDIGNIEKIGKKYFLIDPDLAALQKKIPETPVAAGLFLGEEKKEFRPSPALLEILAKISDKKASINEKAEWLFLCGRDVFEESIVKSSVKEGLVLVQNERDENLGLGKVVIFRGRSTIKNIIDSGEYLRSEGKK